VENKTEGFSCLWIKAGGLTLGPPLLTRARPKNLRQKSVSYKTKFNFYINVIQIFLLNIFNKIKFI